MSDKHAAASSEAESRYIYYLLAASGAALGFTLEKASATGTSLEYALFLATTFSWLLSFYFGLRAVQFRLTALNVLANAENLEQGTLNAKKLLPQANHAELDRKFLESVDLANKALARTSEKFAIYLAWQFRLISTGAVSYVAWKLLPLVE